MPLYPKKPALAVAALAGLMTLPSVVPALAPYKNLDWAYAAGVWEFQPRDLNTAASDAVASEKTRLRPDLAKPAGPVRVAEASGLEHFFDALLQVESGARQDPVRILHYGDSPTTADLITADARALLQQRFGDAGHGFILAGKPWAWYGHRGVDLSASGWQADAATNGAKDGQFGLGGVSFRGEPGAAARWTLHEPHRSIEVAFQRQVQGGRLVVTADGAEAGTVDTAGEPGSGYQSLPLPEGVKRVELQVAGGPVRLFGAELRTGKPGVIYSSLGLNGAYVSVLARFFNADHWTKQLQHYNPDLVVINYGTNESVYERFIDTSYTKELEEVIRRVRTALPEASILVMSPMDRGQRMQDGSIGTVPAIPKLVNMQREIARKHGCAFFNTFEAMGGLGTMGRWYAAEPRLVGADFIHPMPNGARLVGKLLFEGLMAGYGQRKAALRQPPDEGQVPFRQTSQGAPVR